MKKRYRTRKRSRNPIPRVSIVLFGILGAIAVTLGVLIPLHSANQELISQSGARPGANVVRAVRANDFVESIGVTTHFWVNTAAGGSVEGKNPNAVLSKIQRLGVRFYRGYYANSFRNYGLKGMAWVDTRRNDILDPGGIRASLDRYRGYERELIAIEGPNEYDLNGGRDRNKWRTLQTYTREIAQQVRSRPELRSLPIVGPSMASPFNTYSQLASVRQFIDRGNIHPYSGDLRPESYWDEHPPNGHYIEVWKREASKASAAPRIWATEVGWNDTPDRVKAKYAPRTYAWFFKRGVERTTVFQTIDGFNGEKWGLLRPDLSEKPAYFSIKNFISILNDRDATFSPDSLTYTLKGDTRGIETLLLQKGNGTFELLIWQAASCWNRDRKLEVTNPNRNLVLTLPRNVRTARVFMPLLGTSPVQNFRSTNSIPIAVPDHMMIVELSA